MIHEISLKFSSKYTLYSHEFCSNIEARAHEALHRCLMASNVSRELPPFIGARSPTIAYSFALNELVELDFRGSLALTATLVLAWHDPRLTWLTRTAVLYNLQFTN